MLLRQEATLYEPARDLVDVAIERLRTFEPPEGYYLAFSGGKDSVVLRWLADWAGVRYDAHFCLTTIDPPEVVRFVRDQCPGVALERPARSFFQLLPVCGAPRRQRRWCCARLKEVGGAGRVVLTGVRWAESLRRRSRKMVELCDLTRKRYLHPIIDWTDASVWALIRSQSIPYCCLYDEGFRRLGCIACPMKNSGPRRQELRRWPKYEPAFRQAFRRLHAARVAAGNHSVDRWRDGDAMFDWWMSDGRSDPGECFAFD